MDQMNTVTSFLMYKAYTLNFLLYRGAINLPNNLQFHARTIDIHHQELVCIQYIYILDTCTTTTTFYICKHIYIHIYVRNKKQ